MQPHAGHVFLVETDQEAECLAGFAQADDEHACRAGIERAAVAGALDAEFAGERLRRLEGRRPGRFVEKRDGV